MAENHTGLSILCLFCDKGIIYFDDDKPVCPVCHFDYTVTKKDIEAKEDELFMAKVNAGLRELVEKREKELFPK